MTPPLAYWVDRLDPFLVHISGGFGIRYYGLAYLLGFLAGGALLVAYARAGRSLLPAAKVSDFMVAVVLGVVVGGRVGSYFLYDGWRTFASDPLAILRIWEGGMASHGGMLGVVLALAWFARSEKIPFLHLGDLTASTASAGIFFGRIANFINGELWGRPTSVPWAVIFPRSAAEDGGTPLPRHPSQLYEAGLEGVLLLTYMQLRFWFSATVRERPGRLAGEYLLGYALLRLAGEAFREPDASLILGLSRGSFYSLFLIVFGLALILRPGRPLPAGTTASSPAGSPHP